MSLKLEKLAEGTLTVNAENYVTREDGTKLVSDTLALLRDVDGVKKIVYINANTTVQNRFYDFFRGDQYKIYHPLEAKNELHMEVEQ
jgi:hypothetical protein